MYPDFKYVDVAISGAHNRNKLHLKEILGDPTGKVDTYTTYFRYNQEMFEYFNRNIKTNSQGKKYRSVTGYDGQAYCDWIPFDIDNQDLHISLETVQTFIRTLQAYEIDVEACRYYFSGSKGFHVLIPSEMAGIKPSKDIHMRLRNIAAGLSLQGQVDTTIYDKVRLFRMPNTINSKSGLYKVGLYTFEIMSMSVTEILELAKQPREELYTGECTSINQHLQQLYESYKPLETNHTKNEKLNGVKTKICMQSLMNGVGKGNRDNTGLRVAVHLKQSGLSQSMMWAALKEWNRQCDPPLSDMELKRIFNQSLQRYEFGCNDEILKSHCDKNCLFYKEEWERGDRSGTNHKRNGS